MTWFWGFLSPSSSACVVVRWHLNNPLPLGCKSNLWTAPINFWSCLKYLEVSCKFKENLIFLRKLKNSNEMQFLFRSILWKTMYSLFNIFIKNIEIFGDCVMPMPKLPEYVFSPYFQISFRYQKLINVYKIRFIIKVISWWRFLRFT